MADLRRAFSFTLLSALLSLSSSLFADNQQLLQKVYDLSGLEKQFVYMGHTFTEEGLRMGRTELPDNEMSNQLLSRLEEGLSAKYAPERLKNTVQHVLARELDQANIEEIIQIMEGRIWQKAVRLENRANNPDNLSELEQYVSVQLQEKLPRQIRLDLIRDLVQKTNAVDTTMNMMVSGALSAAEIMMGSEKIPAQFEQSMRTQMTSMKAEYEEMVTRQFLFTYRFMSDEQLKTYVSYYNTPAIQSLNKAVTTSLVEAFQ
ncbi:hypothetical protein [Sansalvadorimonas verongulae]|uniref:hypothetical protein n=1 Tax=Sansalvadorimonas verongulae TaxID=2172824 RepID=UPI0012BBA122|nr:hypothetical protein [Sansalvadorimonas verongulae]MTI14864.1 hypothetical protein [Sansalvadorimonas verongulae]